MRMRLGWSVKVPSYFISSSTIANFKVMYRSLIVINPCSGYYLSMNRENRQVVTDELVEFEKQPVGVQDFGKNYQSFWRNLENIPQTNNENRKM